MTAATTCGTCGTEPLENPRFCHSCGPRVVESPSKRGTSNFAVRRRAVQHCLQSAGSAGASLKGAIVLGWCNEAGNDALLLSFNGICLQVAGKGN